MTSPSWFHLPMAVCAGPHFKKRNRSKERPLRRRSGPRTRRRSGARRTDVGGAPLRPVLALPGRTSREVDGSDPACAQREPEQVFGLAVLDRLAGSAKDSAFEPDARREPNTEA